MYKSYLKTGWRNLLKNRIYSVINILGLTAGVAAALLIYHMVTYESAFNKNFDKYDRIVRVVSAEIRSEEGNSHSVCVPIPAMDAIEDRTSSFEKMSRVREFWPTITIPDPQGGAPLKKFNLDRGETGFFAESSFTEIFDFEWIAGQPEGALDEPGSIILTKRWANKFFDDWEIALGNTVLLENLVPVVVKGVIEDLPSNTDFPLPFIVSYETVKNHAELFFLSDDWGSCSSNDQVFALLHSGSSIDEANTLLAGVGSEEYTNESGIQEKKHHAQALSDLHYDDRYGHSGTHVVSKERLRILFGIGMLILVIACFNFVNLATARATTRAREVGVRKTLGSSKKQLILQFMSETGIIVLISVLGGALLAEIGAPILKYISYAPAQISPFTDPALLGFLGMTIVGVTLLAGFYPAITLAAYKPVVALNQDHASGTKGSLLRSTLVVVQFGAAMALIIGTIISLLQLDYVRSIDLGFEDDQIYTFNFNADEKSVARQDALKNKLIQIPGVEGVSFSSDQPISGNTWSSNFRYGSHAEDEKFSINLKFCDAAYQETYGIELVAGQWLNPSDTMRQAVINMTVLRKLGITNPQDAVGERLRIGGRRILPIVGVTKDFHTHSLHREHEPLLMTTRKEFYWEAGLKIRPMDVASTIKNVKEVYDEVLPEQVFNGAFLDESIERFYESESRLSFTCKAFGLLAILISCLGLFGLATHTVTQRLKEIGIRKVLGASVPSIVALLTKEFLRPVVVAIILAIPVIWMIMNKWLQNFAYRIEIEWWVFALSGIAAITVAFLTVSYQSILAAIANPVESIRSE